MALREKVLMKKVQKFEVKGLQNNKVNPACIPPLDKLLFDAYTTRRPKPSDYSIRRDLVRVFNEIAKEVCGRSTDFPVVEEFGSFLMDIFSASSDLDLSVNFSNNSIEIPREQKIKTLRKFVRKFYALQSKGHVSRVNPVLAAKVPILKVVDCGSGIECDLSVENKDGILKSRIVHMISSIDGRFQKLSFLMKAWAKKHNINSSKDRSLNSLSIILLVALHLQTRNPPILPPFSYLLKDGTDPASVIKILHKFSNYGKGNKESLGELFVTLLIKLASVEKLWPKGLCASTYQGSWISKTWNEKIACISVEDFTDRSQNVARAVGAEQCKNIYKHIRITVQDIFSFMNGKIQGSTLIEILFGSDSVPTLADTGLPTNSSVQSSVVHQSTQAKRKQPSDTWAGRLPAVDSNAVIIPVIPGMEGRVGIPIASWGGTPVSGWGASSAGSIQFDPVLTKRMRSKDERAVMPSASWEVTQKVKPADHAWTNSKRLVEGWRPIPSGGWGETLGGIPQAATSSFQQVQVASAVNPPILHSNHVQRGQYHNPGLGPPVNSWEPW